MHKTIFTLILLFSPFTGILSQENLSSGPLRISLQPYLENWSGTTGSDFSVFSTVFNLNYMPARNTNVSLSSRYASVSGDISNLYGFSDAQLFISQKLADYNIILNAGINVPSGKTKLTPEEFLTSRVISQNIFNLKTSGFGQGLNIFLGASWLYPVSEKIVLGAGASYQIKSEYQPISTLSSKYQPSNEISLTAGIDVKFNETLTLTGDITGIFYGKDKFDGKEIFSAGNRLIFNSLLRQYFGYNQLSLMLLYRVSGKGKYEQFNPLVESEKINPDQLYIVTFYNHRISRVTRIIYAAALNRYEKTDFLYSGYTFFEFSGSAEFKISKQITIPVILRYALGSADKRPDLKNYELSAGIRIQF